MPVTLNASLKGCRNSVGKYISHACVTLVHNPYLSFSSVAFAVLFACLQILFLTFLYVVNNTERSERKYKEVT